MRITESRLRRIIREEARRFSEADDGYMQELMNNGFERPDSIRQKTRSGIGPSDDLLVRESLKDAEWFVGPHYKTGALVVSLAFRDSKKLIWDYPGTRRLLRYIRDVNRVLRDANDDMDVREGFGLLNWRRLDALYARITDVFPNPNFTDRM